MNIPTVKSLVLAVFFCSLFCAPVAYAGNGSPTLIGWNNLGMHCMDDDYSVYAILPPYNTLDAQLIDSTGKLVKTSTGYTLTYQAIADPDGSINVSSTGKSNFWTYAPQLFGSTLPANAGIGGTSMPGPLNTPQPLTWSGTTNWFEGLGIPLIPIDDRNFSNSYPLMHLVARSTSNGAVLATTDVVLPVSSEMNCRACHSSGSGPAAQPKAGWVNNPDPKKDYRLSVLLKHDEKFIGQAVYTAALAANGYNANGLYPTVVQNGRAILCAQCHSSNALGTAGYPGVPPLTQSVHSLHATVINPTNGLQMDAIANRSACYQCHPGAVTRCLRGVMGSSVASDGSLAIQCQSCHGTMSQVGATGRAGWLDEPNCQACHTGNAVTNNGQIRYISAIDPATGVLRVPVANTSLTTFATTPNTPATAKSLYRFSSGHSGLQCSACHGSTHAEFPSAYRNDNLQSANLQGHIGMLVECTSCHSSTPSTSNGGPHGMHSIGQSWVDSHGDYADGGAAQCQICHGTDYRGTVLSQAQGNRSVTAFSKIKTFWRGQQISCYECHNGSGGEGTTSKVFPVVPSNTALSTPSGTPVSLTLTATNGATLFRIVQQPAHGTVALSGSLSTYYPDPGFVGRDYFTFAVRDTTNYVDSNLGSVSITVGSATARDIDGMDLLIKYALGLTPGTYVESNGIIVDIEPNAGQEYLTLNAHRSLAPTNVTLTLEVSSDLINWNPGTVVTNSSILFTGRDTLPVTSNPKRFVRLKVTRP